MVHPNDQVPKLLFLAVVSKLMESGLHQGWVRVGSLHQALIRIRSLYQHQTQLCLSLCMYVMSLVCEHQKQGS